MKHAVEIILTLSDTFKGSADQQCVNAKTDFAFLGHDNLFSQIQWGKKVFSQPPIVQVLPLKKMREACNFPHRYTSTMRDKIRKKIQKITL